MEAENYRKYIIVIFIIALCCTSFVKPNVELSEDITVISCDGDMWHFVKKDNAQDSTDLQKFIYYVSASLHCKNYLLFRKHIWAVFLLLHLTVSLYLKRKIRRIRLNQAVRWLIIVKYIHEKDGTKGKIL